LQARGFEGSAAHTKRGETRTQTYHGAATPEPLLLSLAANHVVFLCPHLMTPVFNFPNP
jgi:hypothetical protein